ncbi:hypothetical protein GCM10010495_82220 [Kitasatospora herbaricolor]|uniref:DUF2267 domain-containing protein n=1 Tax=Kitasatospora herbaricolor TaxID=68217 RepID=UPI00174B08A2|nr:DUF2267 domain-containing protein [Kitasatospora herbaricolor]MDQ0305843.1 uncharacterized protein (DUF2267 family) [Kitasatospora herbaricolor]MDQ0305924.1 uncharacterized protein (DUF2267 family) [Kitasatospora herbaricolor]MDQ0306190.1 uncharacterized protein (DUF2267 family) [Kitasatospora herbaricolor]GGV53404.1 hypothetical protein GCM10010495_82220 [Kitasatospora herbaricolor]
MTWQHLLQQVRDAGHYTTDQQAERVLATVLAALGRQLTGDERRDLQAALPDRARALFSSQTPLARPVPAPALVETVATTLDTTPLHARWDVTSVLSALTHLTGEALTSRILAQLPRGYALLYGRADLTTAA